MQGVVKLFDPTTSLGVVISDTGRHDVLIDADSLHGSIFRSLRQGQRIVFDSVDVDGHPTVRNVRVGSEGT